MDYHKNAPWTAISRERLARMVIGDGVTVSSAAAQFSVSAKTAAKWVGRYRQFGTAGMADRSSRPHHSPQQTSSLLVEKVLALRRLSYNGWRIGREVGLSAATVSRILRRARLSRWRDLHPLPPVVRYEHPAPGDLLHLDIKGMTCFEEVSVRGDGRLRGKNKHPGFLALHVAVDDHSRMAFTQMLPDQKAETTIGFLDRAVEFFARHGIGVRALLTDNGSNYRSQQFRQACQRMDIKHRYTRPYTPRTNGKAERFIQTALREWAYACSYQNSQQRKSTLLQWLHAYNWHRPHASLNQHPPISRSGMDRNNLLSHHS